MIHSHPRGLGANNVAIEALSVRRRGHPESPTTARTSNPRLSESALVVIGAHADGSRRSPRVGCPLPWWPDRPIAVPVELTARVQHEWHSLIYQTTMQIDRLNVVTTPPSAVCQLLCAQYCKYRVEYLQCAPQAVCSPPVM